jgi:hypothetical protein
MPDAWEMVEQKPGRVYRVDPGELPIARAAPKSVCSIRLNADTQVPAGFMSQSRLV